MIKQTILTLSLIVLIFSEVKSQENILLPNSFRVAYQIPFDSSYIRISDKTLTEYVFDKVITNKMTVYVPQDYYNNYLYSIEKSPVKQEFKYSYVTLGGSIDTLNILDETTGKINTTVINKKPEPSDIKSYLFFEEWNLNAANLNFSKKVIGYEPIRHYYRAEDFGKDDRLLRRTFSLFPDKDLTEKEKSKSSKALIEIATVTYEFLFENQEIQLYMTPCEDQLGNIYVENPSAPMLNSYAFNNMINTMFQKIKSGELSVYDIQNNTKMDLAAINEKLGAVNDTISIVDTYTGITEMTVIERQFNYREIKSIIFNETILLNPENMLLTKKVNYWAPVRWYYRDDDFMQKNIIKNTVFYIKQ